ncbi:hypothetical protein [Bacillus thuringiensis]|uniref:Uncharacterized protein n=2 Tax=Bacillus thuringiensis TaxID=1428 RepID=A0AAP4QCX2_BACTU|nr:hypothetical protein [Bacillus thuringiensis]ERH97529.1 hypothetical protein BTCBT_006374 [Bacillus thuringiensis T01-328]MBN6708325.1 hypothetical protein [Bacillus thuringiensis]MDN7081739.1 hypothetical protein [Bacillus thuringiensis]MDV6354466.1 hypothetical protein [Bacillus thuringiensis]
MLSRVVELVGKEMRLQDLDNTLMEFGFSSVFDADIETFLDCGAISWGTVNTELGCYNFYLTVITQHSGDELGETIVKIDKVEEL